MKHKFVRGIPEIWNLFFVPCMLQSQAVVTDQLYSISGKEVFLCRFLSVNFHNEQLALSDKLKQITI